MPKPKLPTQGQLIELMKALREHAEWYDHGHGFLHGKSADAIEALVAVVPPGQIPDEQAEPEPKSSPEEPQPAPEEPPFEEQSTFPPEEEVPPYDDPPEYAVTRHRSPRGRVGKAKPRHR